MFCSSLDRFRSLSRDEQISCILTQGTWLEFFESPTEDELTRIIKHNPNYIKYLRKPPLTIFKLAVKLDYLVLRHFTHPVPWEVMWEAIKVQPGLARFYPDEIPYDCQMELVLMDPANVYNIRHVAEDVKTFALLRL